MAASFSGHHLVVNKLLVGGANANQKDEVCMSPSYYFTSSGTC